MLIEPMTFDHASSNLILLLRWYVVIAFLQMATLPLTMTVFRWLPDGGFFLSKAIGMTLTGFVVWLAWAYGLVENGQRDIWLLAVAVGLISWGSLLWGGWRTFAGRVRARLGPLIVSELAFLAGFLALAAIRAIAPEVRHTEQPMDLMILSSLWASPAYPPHDAWLSGHPIAYYYFGYWVQILVGRLSGIGPVVGYNLGLATQFGILVTALFGLGFNLVSSSPLQTRTRPRLAYLGGSMAVVLTALTGNLRSIYDLIIHSRGLEDWWWLSSRAIRDLRLDGTSQSLITEFPAFSYLLGDNHPHLQSSPLLLVAVALALNQIIASSRDQGTAEGQTSPLRSFASRLGKFPISSIFPAFIVAAAGATNSWEVPATFGLLCLGGWVSARGPAWSRLGQLFVWASSVAILAALMLVPFLRTVQGRVFGFLPNLFNPSDLFQFVSSMGPGFLAACILIVALCRRRIGWPVLGWSAAIGSALMGGTALVALATGGGPAWANWLNSLSAGPSQPVWALALRRWATQPFVTLGLLLLLGLTISRSAYGRVDRANAGLQMSLLLIIAGLGLLLVPESIFVHDIFRYRVNTVFKFHYSGWILFGPVGAYALIRLPRTGRHRLETALLTILAGTTLLYPVFAFAPIAVEKSVPRWSLSSSNQFRLTDPPLFQTLSWIDRNTPLDAVVAEAAGEPGEPLSSPVSTFTGRATLLGWLDHERQWRPESFDALFQRRIAAIETIYQTDSVPLLDRLVERYGIDFVVLGPRELRLYGPWAGPRALDRKGTTVYDNGVFRVFEMRGGAGEQIR